jgi:hypothetical protein
MVYRECSKDCNRRCGDRGYKEDDCTDETCVPGCFCPESYYADGDTCVPAELCSCKKGTLSYPIGATIHDTCQTL